MITLADLRKMKQASEKFTCLTVYDASFTKVLENANVDLLLVGDSLGMVIQGRDTTLPVTVNDMIYHTANVTRACSHALIMVDMPFMSYGTEVQALGNAGRLMKEGGAQIVKLEGGAEFIKVVQHLAVNGIPVCAHLGLLPQSVHKLGGYYVQGRESHAADRIFEDAIAMQNAGADLLLLECVPAALSERITQNLDIPVIGIGAGPSCDAQVLVLYDILGISYGKTPKFARNFLADSGSIQCAIENYVKEVKSGTFPTVDQSY